VKNNRDPKNIWYEVTLLPNKSPRYELINESILYSFGAARLKHAKLVYDDAVILLFMIIANNALIGIRLEANL
jgi:hypothetical protein